MLLIITLLCPVKVSVAGSNAKVAIKRTSAHIWPVSADGSACHGPASAPSEEQMEAAAFPPTGGLADTNRHIRPGSLFTGGRSFALLLCHSQESTNMRRDLKSHRSRFPFLTLQTCSDNDGAAESRERPPVSALGWRPQRNAAPPIPPPPPHTAG